MATKKTVAKKTAKKTAAKKSAPKADFAPVFTKLRGVLAKHAKGLVVKTDDAKSYYVVSPKPYQKKELFFGAVRLGKAYVSYHFFPLYVCPELGDELSPALAKHKQGKACLNFKSEDDALFAELSALTAKGLANFRAKGLV
jgi:hypothetical protein